MSKKTKLVATISEQTAFTNKSKLGNSAVIQQAKTFTNCKLFLSNKLPSAMHIKVKTKKLTKKIIKLQLFHQKHFGKFKLKGYIHKKIKITFLASEALTLKNFHTMLLLEVILLTGFC